MKMIIEDNVITVETPSGPIYKMRIGVDSIDIIGMKKVVSSDDTLTFKSIDKNKVRLTVV